MLLIWRMMIDCVCEGDGDEMGMHVENHIKFMLRLRDHDFVCEVDDGGARLKYKINNQLLRGLKLNLDHGQP